MRTRVHRALSGAARRALPASQTPGLPLRIAKSWCQGSPSAAHLEKLHHAAARANFNDTSTNTATPPVLLLTRPILCDHARLVACACDPRRGVLLPAPEQRFQAPSVAMQASASPPNSRPSRDTGQAVPERPFGLDDGTADKRQVLMRNRPKASEGRHSVTSTVCIIPKSSWRRM